MIRIAEIKIKYIRAFWIAILISLVSACEQGHPASISYLGVSLGDSENEVRVQKGVPSFGDNSRIWQYAERRLSDQIYLTTNLRDARHTVIFDNGRVIRICGSDGYPRYPLPSLEGVSVQYDSQQRVEQLHGAPAREAFNEQGNAKTIYYPSLNAAFTIEAGLVSRMCRGFY